jgi:hypothetical protein
VTLKPSVTNPRKIWQLNSLVRPTQNGPVYVFQGQKRRLDLFPILPAGAVASVYDESASDPDLTGGFRLDIGDRNPGRTLFLHVLSLDGAVVAVLPSDSEGQKGVKIRFGDDRIAIVRFHADRAGGVVLLREPDGAQAAACTLTEGVVPLPRIAP